MTTTVAKLSYTVREAADATGFSEDTIRRAIRTGDLPTQRPRVGATGATGRTSRPVILRADLEAWLTS